MRTPSPSARRLSALVLGTVLLAGCSNEEPAPTGPTAGELVRASAAKSTGTGSSKVALTSTTTIGDQDVTFSGEGSYDYAKRTGSLLFQVPGGDGTAAAGGTIEQRLVGDDLYLALPQAKGVFYRLRLADVAGTSLGGSTDPTAALQVLQAVTDVEEVGEQEVRGEAATRYRGEYDVQDALAAAQGPAKTILQTALRAVSAETVQFEAWLDAEGRLVKLVQDLEGASTPDGAAVQAQSTVELFEFGVPVTVTVPPAAQVRDGAPLLAALRSVTPQPTATPTPAATARPTATPAPTASPAG